MSKIFNASRGWLVAVLALAATSSGCGPPVPAANTVRETPTTADVKTTVVAYGPVEQHVTLAGQVNPTEQGRADVTTPLQGIVIEPLVKIGQRVESGTPLAEINSVYGQTPMQLQQKLESDQSAVVSNQNAWQQAITSLGQVRSTLAQARTTLSQSIDNLEQAKAEQVNATTDYHRKQQGFRIGVNAQTDVDDARERYVRARAVVTDSIEQVRLARQNVDIAFKNVAPSEENVNLTRDNVALAQRQVDHDRVIAEGALNPSGSHKTQFYIHSPIGGIVYAFTMNAGLAVSPGTVLASVVDTSSVYVDASAYESDLRGVQVGDPLEVHADGFPNETFVGEVRYVGKQVDPNTRTVAVRALIRNRHDDLRPGLFVQAVLTSRRARQGVLVPNQAVLIDGQDHYVIVELGPGRYQKRKIKEGTRAETSTEVLEGLKPGENVVTHGNLLVVPEWTMSQKPAPARLRKLHAESVAAALTKAEHLRLHQESDVAESICRDILAISPEHQAALVCLILCITDQFRDGRTVMEQARRFIPALHDDYERHYYQGVIFERWARSRYGRGGPDAVALEWYVEAMREFDQARTLSPPHNAEALLRWNACFRHIHADESLRQKFDVLWS